MDLSRYIQPGDTVAWAPLTGAPVGLIQALDDSLPAIGSCEVFIGLTVDAGIRDEHLRHVRFKSTSGGGTGRRYLRNGSVDIIPMHLSDVPKVIRDGKLRIDVLLVGVSPHEENGCVSLGVITDLLPAALERARIVIGERVAGMPWTHGATQAPVSRFAELVDLGSQVVEVPYRRASAAESRIAEHIVDMIPHGATLQFGIGGVPDVVLRTLADHRDMGIHTGILTEAAQALIETGVVTNQRKGIDAGQTVTAYLAGSRAFYDFCDHHPGIQVRQIEYTHNPATLGRIRQLISINSAFEVDLTGQINGEMAGGRYGGQVGGQSDFMRAAAASERGFCILGLPSTNNDETISRIVPKLADGVVTSLRTDVDYVVTEYGAAELRGKTLGERMAAMANLSHPKFREELLRACRLRYKFSEPALGRSTGRAGRAWAAGVLKAPALSEVRRAQVLIRRIEPHAMGHGVERERMHRHRRSFHNGAVVRDRRHAAEIETGRQSNRGSAGRAQSRRPHTP